MKAKELLIALLNDADSDRLDELCYYTPCSGFVCGECPFHNEEQRDLAVTQLTKELADDQYPH